MGRIDAASLAHERSGWNVRKQRLDLLRDRAVSANVFTPSEQLRPLPAPPNIFFHPAARRRMRYIGAVFIAVTLLGLPIMVRSLIWVEGDAEGWACSNCQWRFPVPTLLSGEEAKGAYDRLAAGKFREHQCVAGAGFFAAEQGTKRDASAPFSERARMLIKRGYTPKVAVEIVLHEMEFEQGNNSRMMERARADAEDFLLRVRKGLI